MASLGGFDEKYKIQADYDLMVRIINEGYKMKVIDAVVGNFIIGGTSQSLRSQWKYFLERYDIDKKYILIKYPLFEAATTVMIKVGSLIRSRIKIYFNL